MKMGPRFHPLKEFAIIVHPNHELLNKTIVSLFSRVTVRMACCLVASLEVHDVLVKPAAA